MFVLPITNCFSIDKFFFSETFEGEDVFQTGKWVKSRGPKYDGQPVKIKPSHLPAPGFEDDKGVQLTQELKHYGFSSKFLHVLRTDGNNEGLVVQYEVKLDESLTCGGAYIKLVRALEEETDLENINDGTPYTIMFGPDKCGAVNKVHFILQYQNPVSKQWEEKHFNETIAIRTDKNTHLYTLQIKEDSSFTIFIDMKPVKAGHLLTHMFPAINPEKEIDDPSDHKPIDWVDNAEIIDPLAVKPEDWDESLPRKIPDSKAEMPKGWLLDVPTMIADVEAKKPTDWDDEEVSNRHYYS